MVVQNNDELQQILDKVPKFEIEKTEVSSTAFETESEFTKIKSSPI